jgi:hypothetical protein
VTNQTFAAGDDVTTAFTLARAWGGFIEPIGACAGSPTIYRTDWQGTQQLYLTARTNLLVWSEQLDNATWTKQSGCVITPNATAAPDGSMTADLVDLTGASVGTGFYNITNGSFGGLYNTKSIWLKGVVGGEVVTLVDPSHTYGLVTCTLTTAWQRFSLYESGQSTGAGVWIKKSSGNQVYAWGGQLEIGVLTSYIPTTTVAVTVSDYSISGTTVTLSSALAATATLQWSGGYYYRVRFKEDVAEFNQFMSKLWELKSLELVSVK